ncbi:tudor and KH domain-containing protein isoform X2 [Exaiptasia diaphana]|uniref:K Homology domain-containing protein n=1 Tax=Exaiptasia diaphana TaxID=2652724 RepID=A0A913X840_EXADI|nr:tudor and KH domain-containing protein isoform X2 [Exaiptasia diaphana]
MPTFSSEQRLAIAVGVPTLALLFFLWYRRRQRDNSFDDDDDEDEEEPTVARAFETKIEVQIPKLLVGTVIGRGGANIKQIQRESGAYLRFKDDDENEEVVEFDEVKPDPEKTRTVVIKGERENARKAEFLIKKIISEQPKMLTEEYYVPQRSCGRIIGRGGMTIRHLSKVSGARITIDREEIRPDIPRKCTIVGTADQIANAKGLLDEKIAEHEKFMTRRPPNQMSRSNKKDFDVAQSKETNMSSPVPYTVQFPDTSDFIEVFVSAIDNPEHFYVQLVRTGEAQKLDQLIEAVTEEATSGSAEKFVESIENYCVKPINCTNRKSQ